MTENSSPLDVLYDSSYQNNQRVRVGISMLRHVEDEEEKAAAQLGLEMILPKCDERLQGRVHAALLRYCERREPPSVSRPVADFKDGSLEMESTILDHYPDCVYERFWEAHKNDPRRVQFRKYNFLKMTDKRYARVHDLDCPKSLSRAADTAVAQMPDDQFILPPGASCFDWEYDED